MFGTFRTPLQEDGREITHDVRPGTAGKTNVNNVYRPGVKNYKPLAHYSLKMEGGKVKGTKCKGDIKMRLAPGKQQYPADRRSR